MDIALCQMQSRPIIEEFVDTRSSTQSERHKRMKQAYQCKNIFVKLPIAEKAGFYLSSLRFNACKIANVYLGCIAGGAMTGAAIGAIVGSLTANPAGVASCCGVGASTGAGVGAALGTAVCLGEEYWYEKKLLHYHVKTSSRYPEIMRELTAEHYKIFLDFLKYYFQYLPEEITDKLEDFVCEITYMIPKEPVFSPHDVLRAHVFEKAALEAHIDNVEARIAEARARGASRAEIKVLEGTVDPFRGPYFKKEELLFDISYAKKAIKFLRQIQKAIPGAESPSHDPRLPRALFELIAHYNEMFLVVTSEATSAMMSDMLALGVKPSCVLTIGKKFDESFQMGLKGIHEGPSQVHVDEETYDLMKKVKKEIRIDMQNRPNRIR